MLFERDDDFFVDDMISQGNVAQNAMFSECR